MDPAYRSYNVSFGVDLGYLQATFTSWMWVIDFGLCMVIFHPPQTMPEISFLQQLLPYNNWFKLGILFFGGALFSFSPQPPTINIDLLIVALLALTIFPNSSISQIVIFLTLPYLVITISSTKSRASAVLSRMGDFSYGLYIYAFPVQQTVASILLDSSTPLKIFAYSFPITLFFAVISWHFIEKPCISLKRFLPTFKNTPLKTSSNID